MTTVCLCMIVKDEKGIIERCLRSVRDLIDHWVICDTGSTDGTQEIVRAELASVPGELHERPWVDFGHNRSEALELARGSADYLLLLDADWTFEAQPAALAKLTADAYLVRLGHPEGTGFDYYNRQLVRGDRRWWYVGAAHEYIATDDAYTEDRLHHARIVNHYDGNVGREHRFRRDAELLEASVSRSPDNERDVFYLAQTYRDLGELPHSIELYRRRLQLGGFDEELFYARYQIGVLHAQLGDWAAAVPALLDAWNSRPTRIESLYQLALGYRLREQWPAAHLFARRALAPEPDDILFVESWIYRWAALFEYSVAAYWVGDFQESLRACDSLLARSDLPVEYRGHTVSNRDLCLQQLGRGVSPRARSGSPSARRPRPRR